VKHEIAFDLGPLVKNPKLYEAVKDYARARIEEQHKKMETTLKQEDWLRAQGAVNELRRLLGLPEEVEQTIKDFKNKNG
jgi:hypothetical protein